MVLVPFVEARFSSQKQLGPEQNIADPTLKEVADLDRELLDIINDKNTKDSEKVKLYNQTLSRFQAKYDKLMDSKNFQAGSQPISTQTTESASSTPASPPPSTQLQSAEPQQESSSLDDAVSKLPKHLKNKTQQLLRLWKKSMSVNVGHDGALVLNGKEIANSNAGELLSSLVGKQNQTQRPHGWEELVSFITSMKLPLSVIKSPARGKPSSHNSQFLSANSKPVKRLDSKKPKTRRQRGKFTTNSSKAWLTL